MYKNLFDPEMAASSVKETVIEAENVFLEEEGSIPDDNDLVFEQDIYAIMS
jgi:hypothetical protein